MRFLARLAMRGPFHAAAIAAAALLGSLHVGLLIVISGAVMALVTLRHGSREGLRVMGLGTSFALAVHLAISGNALPILVLCMVVWLPVWLMAVNLARTQRQATPLLMVAVMVVTYALAMRFAVGDVATFWAERLNVLFELLENQGGTAFPPEKIRQVAAHIHVWSLVALFTMITSMLLLGRWWQSVLYNPGGFATEFQQLRMPRGVVSGAAMAGVGVVLDRLLGLEMAVVSDVFVTAVVLFAFQGLAVVHCRARAVKLARGWLVGLYFLLAFVPQLVGPLLATAGAADSVANFRRLSLRADKTDG